MAGEEVPVRLLHLPPATPGRGAALQQGSSYGVPQQLQRIVAHHLPAQVPCGCCCRVSRRPRAGPSATECSSLSTRGAAHASVKSELCLEQVF